jgi:outer membrane protein TolC
MSGMKKKIITGIITLFAVSLFAQEKSVSSYSLKEAIDYALQNNVNAKNAKLDMKKAKAYNLEILTQGLPNLSGSFEYDYYFKTPLVPAVSNIVAPGSPFATALAQLSQNSNDPALVKTLNSLGGGFSNISFVLPNDISTGITLTQLLFDARYVFGLKARKELYLTSRLQSDLSDQDIRTNITKAYSQAEAAQEAKSLLLENKKIVDKILADTRAVFAQGLTEELDVNRLELAQANLEMQINQQNNMAEVALANLKFQMGLNLDEVIILKDKLDDLRASVVPQQNAFDPKNRVEYQLLTAAITLDGYNMRAKRSGYYPSLGGFLNYSGNVQTEAFSDMFKGSEWYPQGLVGIKLNVPIFDSGLKYAQVQQVKLEQMKRQNSRDNFVNAANLQYQSALSNFNAAVGDEVSAQKTLDLSKKIFTTNEAKFKQGAGSSFELQQSEQEYATNELKQIQTIINLLNAKADLDKAMGVK